MNWRRGIAVFAAVAALLGLSIFELAGAAGSPNYCGFRGFSYTRSD